MVVHGSDAGAVEGGDEEDGADALVGVWIEGHLDGGLSEGGGVILEDASAYEVEFSKVESATRVTGFAFDEGFGFLCAGEGIGIVGFFLGSCVDDGGRGAGIDQGE